MTEESLRSILRNDLLPSAQMILSMSKEFGVPLNGQDMESIKASSSFDPDGYSADAMSDFKKSNDTNEYNNEIEEKRNIPHTSRIWTPLDNDNNHYLQEKFEKQSQMRNFVASNIESVHEKSERNK